MFTLWDHIHFLFRLADKQNCILKINRRIDKFVKKAVTFSSSSSAVKCTVSEVEVHITLSSFRSRQPEFQDFSFRCSNQKRFTIRCCPQRRRALDPQFLHAFSIFLLVAFSPHNRTMQPGAFYTKRLYGQRRIMPKSHIYKSYYWGKYGTMFYAHTKRSFSTNWSCNDRRYGNVIVTSGLGWWCGTGRFCCGIRVGCGHR